MSTHVPAALDQGTGYGIVLGLGALFAFGKICATLQALGSMFYSC